MNIQLKHDNTPTKPGSYLSQETVDRDYVLAGFTRLIRIESDPFNPGGLVALYGDPFNPFSPYPKQWMSLAELPPDMLWSDELTFDYPLMRRDEMKRREKEWWEGLSDAQQREHLGLRPRKHPAKRA